MMTSCSPPPAATRWGLGPAACVVAQHMPQGCKGTRPKCRSHYAILKRWCTALETWPLRSSHDGLHVLSPHATHARHSLPLPLLMQLMSYVREGLRDFSISRAAVDWGIRVPQDPKHTVYVWFDALIGE